MREIKYRVDGSDHKFPDLQSAIFFTMGTQAAREDSRAGMERCRDYGRPLPRDDGRGRPYCRCQERAEELLRARMEEVGGLYSSKVVYSTDDPDAIETTCRVVEDDPPALPAEREPLQ